MKKKIRVKVLERLYPQYYIVTEYGDVYLMYKDSLRRLRVTEDKNGYLRVCIKTKQHYIHRLVIEAFCGDVSYQVRHIDEDVTNNHISNLECVDKKERNYSNEYLKLRYLDPFVKKEVTRLLKEDYCSIKDVVDIYGISFEEAFAVKNSLLQNVS